MNNKMATSMEPFTDNVKSCEKPVCLELRMVNTINLDHL